MITIFAAAAALAGTSAALRPVDIALGDEHTCARMADGRVRCWGRNEHGQIGDGTTADRPRPTVVRGVTGASAVAAGGAHTCAVVAGGRVRCWGRNDEGQLGDGTRERRGEAVAVKGLDGVVAIALGRAHGCARRSDGTVWCWGAARGGQLGDGHVRSSGAGRDGGAGGEGGGAGEGEPVAVPEAAGALAVGAGGNHSCALLPSGSVLCWGENLRGELGSGAVPAAGEKNPLAMRRRDRDAPAPVAGIADAVELAVGGRGGCVRRQGGAVLCWGKHAGGIPGAATEPSPVAVELPPVRGASLLAVGMRHACAVVEGGRVRCWGDNRHGQIGIGDMTPRPIAAPVLVPGLTDVVRLALGGAHSCALDGRGALRCWGDHGSFQLGDGTERHAALAPVAVRGLREATGLAVGARHTCVRGRRGALACWGSNATGQLGDGTTTDRALPASVLVDAARFGPVTRLAAGGSQTCAGDDHGRVACWGSAVDASGANPTGAGSTRQERGEPRSSGANPGEAGSSPPERGEPRSSGANPAEAGTVPPEREQSRWSGNIPAEGLSWGAAPRILGGSAAVEIAVGRDHGCARDRRGGVSCWGRAAEGQIGDGDGTFRRKPAPVALPGPALSLNLGADLSCARLREQTLCWGGGEAASTPAPRAALAEYIDVRFGARRSCGVRKDGRVLCWSDGGEPVLVAGLEAATAVAPGESHACALLQGGKVSCWGDNDQGQLGDGTTTNRATPISVTGLAEVVAIAAGDHHTCARLDGGGVRCWGRGNEGQLGDGRAAHRPSPVPVSWLPPERR